MSFHVKGTWRPISLAKVALNLQVPIFGLNEKGEIQAVQSVCLDPVHFPQLLWQSMINPHIYIYIYIYHLDISLYMGNQDFQYDKQYHTSHLKV